MKPKVSCAKARRAPAASDGEGDGAGNDEAAQFAAELKAAVAGPFVLIIGAGQRHSI